MSDNITAHKEDDKMNVNTYKAVMDFSAKIGIPVALGLTSMFTSLVLANGVIFSIVAGIVTVLAVFIIVKMFFSH